MSLSQREIAERALGPVLMAILGPNHRLRSWVQEHDGEAGARVEIEGSAFGLDVVEETSVADYAVRLFDELVQTLPTTERYWGQELPPCPGHPHGLQVQRVGYRLFLVCPVGDGSPLGEIRI